MHKHDAIMRKVLDSSKSILDVMRIADSSPDPMERMVARGILSDGGPGSGNSGHSGRPGQVGGSGGGQGGLSAVSGEARRYDPEKQAWQQGQKLGAVKAKGYSMRSSKVRRSPNGNARFVTKGSATKNLPNGSGNSVFSESDLSKGPHSILKHMDENGQLTPDRAKLHEETINALFEGKKPVAPGEQKTFYMLGGGPASGKGSLTNPEYSKDFGMPSKKEVATIDPDEMKKAVPEYWIKNRSAGANFAHEESSTLAKRGMEAAFANGYNCTLDGTGDGSVNSMMKKIKQARDAGYKVEGAYVTVPTEVAIPRAMERGIKQGRIVPEKDIRRIHAEVSRIFPQIAPEFDHVVLYDTSGPKGSKPVMIAECFRGQPIQVKNQKLWQAFLGKGKEENG